MKDQEQIVGLLQELSNILCESIKWEDEAMSRAQRLGLQGEKRRNRYESSKNRDLLNYIRCFTYDVFKTNLRHESNDIQMQPTGDFSTYFSVYLRKLNTMYSGIHEIANKLVLLHMQPFAKQLYCRLESIMDDIIDTNRTIEEGNQTNWSADFIFLHQTTALNVHDHWEKKEEDNGYKY